MKTKFALILILLTSSIRMEAYSTPILPPTITSQNQVQYTLCSMQTITKALFFDVLNVGLYYYKCPDKYDIFDNTDKLIRFSYLRKVTGKQFSEGADEFLRKNLSKNLQFCLPVYNDLNSSYKDVGKGDYYDLYFYPTKGLELFFNSQHLITMTNLDCDNAYFNIWFGKKSMNSGFKKLLGKQ